jgi:hypothetical protein
VTDGESNPVTLYIKRAGEQMQAALADYEATGCLYARSQADKFRMEIECAIAVSSFLQFRRMEVERGFEGFAE